MPCPYNVKVKHHYRMIWFFVGSPFMSSICMFEIVLNFL